MATTSLEWMNVTYDAEFASPAFDLSTNNTSVLRAIYETFLPQFRINSRDMHVTGGNVLSDVHVRASLFNGNGSIDISADKMSLVFNNLRTENEFLTCQRCVLLGEEVLKKSLPAARIGMVAIKPTLFLELDGGDKDVGAHLAQSAVPSIQLDLGEFGSAIQYPGLNVEVGNPQERWDALFHAFRDRMKPSSLILNCQAIYQEDGAVRGLENRVHHLKRLLWAFLDSAKLELEGLKG